MSGTIKNAPKLTIGMPVYNSERYLKESVDSLLGQTYDNFILLISDNASTDGTTAICEEYARRDSRVVYHRNAENIGMSPNFNLVAERCKTPFFKWSTADDYWAPTMIERCMEVIEADPEIALCYPKTTLVNAVAGTEEKYNDNLHIVDDDPAIRFRKVLSQIGLCNLHLGISRTSCLQRTRMLRTFPGADLNLMANLSLYGKFYEVPEYLFFRRFHEDSSSWARGNVDHQIRRFHSAKTKNIKLNLWRGQMENFAIVMGTPLASGTKLRLIGYLLRQMFWAKYRLTRELWHKLTG